MTGPSDGCPNCVYAVAEPFRTVQENARTIRCWYRCGRCLWSWWTCWSAEIWRDVA